MAICFIIGIRVHRYRREQAILKGKAPPQMTPRTYVGATRPLVAIANGTLSSEDWVSRSKNHIRTSSASSLPILPTDPAPEDLSYDAHHQSDSPRIYVDPSSPSDRASSMDLPEESSLVEVELSVDPSSKRAPGSAPPSAPSTRPSTPTPSIIQINPRSFA
jgi:hypothetical protein